MNAAHLFVPQSIYVTPYYAWRTANETKSRVTLCVSCEQISRVKIWYEA